MVSSPTPGTVKPQVEGGFRPTCSRSDQMCPAVVPRWFRIRRGQAVSRQLLAPLELLVPVTTRVSAPVPTSRWLFPRWHHREVERDDALRAACTADYDPRDSARRRIQ